MTQFGRQKSANLSAEEWAESQVAAVRDDPVARLALLRSTYRGPSGRADRQLPYQRAASSFMLWEERRGILNSPDGPQPGSPWWRAVNSRLLLDACEAVARLDGRRSEAAKPSVRLWLSFISAPTAARWYQAHNASTVAAYINHRPLAERESAPERFLMNVVLLRVLYAHALIGNRRLALGWFAPLGRLLGDPRLGMAGVFLSLSHVLPNHYPLLEQEIAPYLADEHQIARIIDYAIIAPRLQALYEWSADALHEPELLKLIDRGSPVYAWSYDQRDVWHAVHLSWPARALGAAVKPRS